jgi:hypothetical protein
MRIRMILGGMLTACALELVLPVLVAAQINIDINLGTPPLPPPPPPIVVTAPPQLVVIPGTTVSYAPAMPYNYFFYGRRYYVFHEGMWFYGPAHRGPWTFIAVEKVPKPLLRVPVTYYKVPPGHRREEDRHPWKGHHKEPKHKKHGHHDD